MSKDHTPSDFARKSGYKSDLEIAETGDMVKSVNTSFGSQNQNAYIHRTDGTHEHFYYSPKDARSGWHGHNWETKNNHPQQAVSSKDKGENNMDRNEFVESIKADKATIERCNEVSHNAAKVYETHASKGNAIDDGGRERGDTGPASLGRESGYKCGSVSTHNEGQGHNAGSGSTGHGAVAGHDNSGQGSGGQGAGGQAGGGHGGH